MRRLADLKGKPIMLGDAATVTTLALAESEITASTIRKSANTPSTWQPFLVDPNAIQEGYLTSEP